MKGSRLYWQHFLITGGMVLLSFVLLAIVFISMSYQYTVRENKDNMERNATHIASLTASMLSSGYTLKDENFRIYVTSVAAVSDSTVIITSTDGALSFCSNPAIYAEDNLEAHIPRYILEPVLVEGGYAAMTTFDGQLKETSFAVGRPVDVDTVGGVLTVGMVFVVSTASTFMDLWGDFAAIFLAAMLVVLCVSLLSASVSARRQTQPLKEMAEAARAFGHGDFQVRVPDDGGQDEMAALGRAFNSMADSLSQAESRRREFVANISHELKTPMTTISGFVDGILDGTIPRERADEYLRVVSAETRRLSRLVRRMLELSRLQARAGEAAQSRFDIVDILSQVLVGMETRITDRQLDVDAQLPETPVVVQGDADGITQVCYNLLDNAVKFSQPGTRLGLSVTVERNKALVSVRNHGETIPPEELNDVFERFHKTDRSRSMDKDGVGLGLYIVKTILNSHGENIAVFSQDGVTEFVFTLTLAKPGRPETEEGSDREQLE